ncbi:hypothetical protein [Hahella ganghwensis]|uniref:hypothetical protein n=1 Tax=Hahella ganghwensis TaxID=286420 RepID=UPI000372279B|nr:hypothetical protein [Hahella ganghwensis]
MTDFIYACQKAKIDSGELQRMSSIVEYYLDSSGAIALTQQNANLHRYGDQTITAQQKEFIKAGDRKSFWYSRRSVGDPIAEVAIPILEDSGINGRVANWLTTFKGDPRKLNQLGVDLMIEHAKAVTYDLRNCIGNVPGVLSPEQVAEYHHIVFKKHGVGSGLLSTDGSWLFGGTLFNLPPDLYRMIWCHSCDFLGTGIGSSVSP